MSEPISIQSLGLSDAVQTRVCEIHGEYASRNIVRTVWSRCPACETLAAEKREAADRAADLARRQHVIAGIMRRSGIPERFQGKAFDGFQTTNSAQVRVQKVCRAYADKFEDRLANGGGLVLCGLPGTGKTHLACAIANHIALTGRTSVFTSVLAAVRRVKETYSRDSKETEQAVIDRFFAPDLLILDEVGVQFGTDAEKLILFEIINGRYERMRPTILISNLAEAELAAFVGDRAMDRMREGGGAALAFDWASERAKVKVDGSARAVDWDRLEQRGHEMDWATR